MEIHALRNAFNENSPPTPNPGYPWLEAAVKFISETPPNILQLNTALNNYVNTIKCFCQKSGEIKIIEETNSSLIFNVLLMPFTSISNNEPVFDIPSNANSTFLSTLSTYLSKIPNSLNTLQFLNPGSPYEKEFSPLNDIASLRDCCITPS